jgi:hypothetical protein
MAKVTLHVHAEPYEADEFDGNKVIGEVKRGDEILHKKEIITDDSIESVCSARESIGLEIEIWAVQNTDFQPTEDALPA